MIHVNAPHPLSRLIQSVEDGQGWTDREVSRRVSEAGLTMSHSYIGKLKNRPIQSVTASMVKTLAIGLGISEAAVAAASMESMGVRIRTDVGEGLDVAIAQDPDLTDYDRRLLRAVVKEMRGADGNGTGRPGTDATDEPAVEDRAVPDGATTWWQDFDLAADEGERRLDEKDAAARRAGEESQDPADYR